MPVECVIVDNNSSPPVESIPFVRAFSEQSDWVKIIKERRQGLSFSRIAGIQSTSFRTVVFVDDDNVLDDNYLISVQNCLQQHPCVAVWGPGKVDVEFSEPAPDWFDTKIRKKFQERNAKYTEYGCVSAQWMHFYPFGTGMVVRREILDSYCQAVEHNHLSSQGRTGKSLSSGEDIQIVWEAVKMGWAAGTSPDLKVRHLIPEKRVSLRYVKRLTFGTASSYTPALVESFPEMLEPTVASLPSDYQVLSGVIKRTIKYVAKFKFQFLQVELAHYLGGVVGATRATGSSQKIWISKAVQMLSLT